MRAYRLLLLAASLVVPAAARADVLSLDQVSALAHHLDCVEACEAGPAVALQTCVLGCGAVDPAWEKDGAPGTRRQDLDLAQLERAGEGEFCYRPDANGLAVVVPASLCVNPVCQGVPACSPADCAASNFSRPPQCRPQVVCDARPERNATDCADVDQDGIPAWLERATGGKDFLKDTFCTTNAECDLVSECRYDAALGSSRCQARTCVGPCTVFHLEKVAADDQQVLVHVVYDYSPVPPQALELFIDYDHAQLLLADARPLPNLTTFHQSLFSTQTADHKLRLVIWDPAGGTVHTGPLVELVFQRVGTGSATVSFVTDDPLHQNTFAPEPESAALQAALGAAAVWGAAVNVGSSTDATDDRLLVWYTFDDENNPLALSNVPSADALCDKIPECANAATTVDKDHIKARLERLQKGSFKSSGVMDGVSRKAMVLDGETDHLRLPVHVLQPRQGTGVQRLEAAGQSFSVSTWVYSEGFRSTETAPQVLFSHLATSERTRFGLLLQKEPGGKSSLQFFTGDVTASTTMRLTPVGAAFPDRTWHHVAFSLDASTGVVTLYLDGAQAGTPLSLGLAPAPIACPTFTAGGNVSIPQQGAFTGGHAPEVLYFAPRRGSLYQVERMDAHGLASQKLVSDGTHNFQDVDYQPLLDKLVFASDASGSMEIYVANGDGTQAKQVTVGFGDVSRNLEARRPRWALDGSGLVFESNMYSASAAHNPSAAWQLYYVGFDPAAGQVAGRLDDGSTVTQLTYATLASSLGLGAFQLTDGEHHSTNAYFIAKKTSTSLGEIVFQQTDLATRHGQVRNLLIPLMVRNGSSAQVPGLGARVLCDKVVDLGTATLRCPAGTTITSVVDALYATTTSIQGTCGSAHFTQAPTGCGKDVTAQVSALCLGKESCSFTVNGTSMNGDPCENVQKAVAYRVQCSWPSNVEQHLLTAGVRATGHPAVDTQFLVFTRRAFGQPLEPSTQFTFTRTSSSTLDTLSIRHTPTGYDADRCWDLNHNGTRDVATEDANGDGSVTPADCYPVEAFFFVRYDATRHVPRVGAADIQAAREGTVLAPADAAKGKNLNLVMDPQTGVTYLRVEITSPRNALPLPEGVVANIRFDAASTPSNAPVVDYAIFSRAPLAPWDLAVQQAVAGVRTAPVAVDLLTGDGASAVPMLEDVSGAALSPDGTRLVLAGISHSRPVLVRTTSLTNLKTAVRIGEFSAPVRGLSWLAESAYFPCNWAGGVLDPNTGTLLRPLRGALDDLKMHAGVRDADSIRSEAAVGLERLEVQGRLGQGTPRAGLCSQHTECGAFEVCQSGACTVLACDPSRQDACADVHARCTLRPDSVRAGSANTTDSWVCAVDCVADAECFSQSCANGPCRFCQPGDSACVECRDAEQDYGDYIVRGIEGCPDSNSFACEDGTCRTECYTVADGQSTYRCDPALEYCRAGRCQAMSWDWGDLAPATLSGLGDTGYASVPGVLPTEAVPQDAFISFKAYGKGDYGRSPEVLVEGKLTAGGASLYDGEWFRVGRVMVDHRTAAEANARPYVLTVPHPVSDLRMRLVRTPYENLEAAATGLGARDKDFCPDDVNRRADGSLRPSSNARCVHRPPGSAQHLGYPAEVPFDIQATACARNGGNCPSVVDQARVYLGDGMPGVIVKDVTVNGSSVAIASNPVCSWADTLQPVDPATRKRRKLYYGDVKTELSATQQRELNTAPPPMVPPVTDGLTAHFNARARQTLTINAAGAVTLWNSASGPARLLYGGGAAPVYSATLLGTLPGVDFSGGKGMTSAAFPLTRDVTVFVVYQHTGFNRWGAILHHGSRDADWSLEQSGLGSDDPNLLHWQSENDNAGAQLSLDSGARYVLAGRISGNNRVLTATKLGGTPATVLGTGNNISAGTKVLYLGRSDAGEASNAKIGEIVYYNRALSDAETAEVTAYLVGAWSGTPSGTLPTTSLKEFTGVSRGGYGLLNCNYNASPTQMAALNFAPVPIRQRQEWGAVRESGAVCQVEVDQVRRENCYSYTGGDAVLDPVAAEQEIVKLLEVTLPRGFAHDLGYTSQVQPTAPVKVEVSGLPAGERVRLSCAGQSLEVSGGATLVPAQFPTPLVVGRTFSVTVAQQPPALRASVSNAAAPYLCLPAQNATQGTVAADAPRARIHCVRAAAVDLSAPLLGTDSVTAKLTVAGPSWSLDRVAQADTFVLTRQTPETGAASYTTLVKSPAAGTPSGAATGGYQRPTIPGRGYFPTLIPVGGTVTVEVVQQPSVPRQQCTVGTSGDFSASFTVQAGSASQPLTGVSVTLQCVNAPNNAIAGTLSGLRRSGLVLRSTFTGQTLAIAANATRFGFASVTAPGQPYEVTMDAQPQGQSCALVGAAGIMPINPPADLVKVVCSDKPAFTLPVRVTGLVGLGLQLSLNGSEVLPVAASGTYAFATQLLDGANYTVDVVSQPHTPDQDCQLVAGTGTGTASSVLADAGVGKVPEVICTTRILTSTDFTIGGRVLGLLGRGLRLGVGYTTVAYNEDGGRINQAPPAQTLDISRNGDFTFNQPAPDNNPYLVQVLMQPTDPPQTCSVSAGETGRILGRNVTNIEVRCSGSSELQVTLRWNGAAPNPAQALRLALFDSTGAAVARSPRGRLDGPNNAVFSLVVPTAANATEVPAALLAGTYTLVGLDNTDKSTDGQGAATFNTGDKGTLRSTITVTANPITAVTLTMDDYAPSGWVDTTTEPVTVQYAGSSGDAFENASLTCYWLPHRATADPRPSLPLRDWMATSTLTCRTDMQPCFRYRQSNNRMAATTTVHTPLPPGSYDVVCWVDRGGPNNGPDNILNAGDRVGWAFNQNFDGPEFQSSETIVTLEQP